MVGGIPRILQLSAKCTRPLIGRENTLLSWRTISRTNNSFMEYSRIKTSPSWRNICQESSQILCFWIWKGDILVADTEESKIRARRLSAREVLSPIANGTVNLSRKRSSLFENPPQSRITVHRVRKEHNDDLQRQSEKSQPLETMMDQRPSPETICAVDRMEFHLS